MPSRLRGGGGGGGGGGESSHTFGTLFGTTTEQRLCETVPPSLTLSVAQGVIQQITINDLPIGRSVDETLRLLQAIQYVAKYESVGDNGAESVGEMGQKVWEIMGQKVWERMGQMGK